MNLVSRFEKAHTTGKISWERDNKIHTLENKEFWELVKQVQFGLKNQGIQEGDKVLVQYPNSPEWLILDLAILSLGAINIALPWQIQEETAKILIERTSPKLILSQSTNPLKKTPKETLSKYLKSKKQTEITPLKKDAIATIIFTSGSSNTPKAVPLTHTNLDYNIKNQPFDVLPGTYLSYLPISHAFERTCGVYNALNLNMNICFLDDPKKLSNWIRVIKPRFILLVPTILKKLKKKSLEKKRTKLVYKFFPRLVGKLILKKLGGNIQYLICGSAPLSADLQEFVKKTNLPLYVGYGMSEAGPLISANTPKKNDLASVGTPLKGVEIQIVDKEIQIKSPGLFSDYLPPDSINRKQTDWFKTGDAGYMENDLLYVTGRVDDLLVFANGKKIQPHIIEEQLENAEITNAIVTKKEGYPHALIDSEKSTQEIQEIIDAYNQTSEKHFQIRSWKKLPKLTAESGYLTATLKKKRKKILKEFHENL